MFRQVIAPTAQNHTIELPVEFYGKKVEITTVDSSNPQPGAIGFLSDIEPIPDFPSIESIRKEAWPDRW